MSRKMPNENCITSSTLSSGKGRGTDRNVVYRLMDDIHLLTAHHFRYELRYGGKIFSTKFGAREVCIASQKF